MKIYVLLLPFILAACGTTVHDDLNSKLAGKTPEQKRAILAEECSKQVANPHNPKDPGGIHGDNMKQICKESTGYNVP